MRSIDQRIESAMIRDYYAKHRPLSGQGSLFDENLHPRNDLGEFAKKGENSVSHPESVSVSPTGSEVKSTVGETKMNAGNGTVNRDELLAEIAKWIGRYTDAPNLQKMMNEESPRHIDEQSSKYMLDNPQPIPDLFERMLSGGFISSGLSEKSRKWPSQARKHRVAMDAWREANPNSSEIKFDNWGGEDRYVQIVDPSIGSTITEKIEEMTPAGIERAVKALKKSHKAKKSQFKNRVAAERSVDQS